MTARPTFAYFNLRFSKSLTDFNVSAIDSTTAVHTTLETDLTTLKVYNTFPSLDSIQVRAHATDSMNFTVDTLVYIKFPKKEATKDKFTASIESSDVTESNATLTSRISFTKPVLTFNLDSIYIKIDSVTRIPFVQDDFTWNANRTKLTINKKVDLARLFPKDTTATVTKDPAQKDQSGRPPKNAAAAPSITQLLSKKSAFISVENDSSINASAQIRLLTLESTAIIEAEVKTTTNFVLQLVTKLGKVVSEVRNQKKYSFENLPPETYQLRLIVDRNNNGKWDPGNFTDKTEPEPVIYYRNPKGVKDISLKANWTLGPLLITY